MEASNWSLHRTHRPASLVTGEASHRGRFEAPRRRRSRVIGFCRRDHLRADNAHDHVPNHATDFVSSCTLRRAHRPRARILEGMGWFTKRPSLPAAPLLAPAPALTPALVASPSRSAPRAGLEPNTLTKGTSVRGDLRSDAGFRIDGQVDGSIESGGPVTIGESGSVSGLVRGTDVAIEGIVTGDVHATGHLEVGARGRLIGDATAKSVRVADGGVLHGMSRMGNDDERPASAAAPASEPTMNVSGERWLSSDLIQPDEPGVGTATG
jgi:cytoskeletal protein CcmA (bactofilin family)